MSQDERDFSRKLSAPIELDFILEFSAMSRDDLLALKADLITRVPKRQFGDGVGVFEDFIRPHHAQTHDMFEDANRLYWARKLLDEFESDDFSEDSDRLTGAVTLAIEALASLDIIYQGLRGTLVYWSEEQECFIQIDVEQRKQGFLEAQRKIGYRFDVGELREEFGENADLPDSSYTTVTPEQRAAAESWLQEHPARWGGASLSTMIAIELVEPQSRLWHIIRVLECHEWMQEIRKSIASRSSMSTVSQSELLDYVHDVSEICVAMGKSAEALEKKPIEYEAAASQ
jgi:hypothetical protein